MLTPTELFKSFQRVRTSWRVIIILTISLLIGVMHVHPNLFQMNSTGNTCAKLFQTGSLKWNLKDATAIWEPNGCSLQYRSINEAKQCMNDLTDKTSKVPFLLFVGDSRIQQLRDGLILTLTGHDYDVRAGRQSVLNSTSYSQLGADENIYKSSGIQIKFEWQPYLDNGFGPMSSFLKNVSKLQFRPNMLVIGAGVWSIKDCQVNNKNQDACVQNYKEQFKAIHPLLEEMASTTDVIWTPQCAISEKVLSYNNKDLGFTNRNMHLYNDVVRQVLMDAKRSGESKVIFWESAWEASVRISDGIDGLHLGHETKFHLSQMLIDYMCQPIRRKSMTLTNATKAHCCE